MQEEKERDRLANIPDVVAYRCRDLVGRDRIGDWEEVGVGEGLLDTLIEEVVCRHIGNVSRVSLASTTDEHANDVTIDITDDRPRVPRGGESTILVIIGVDGNLHRCRVNGVILVFTNKRFDPTRTTKGNTSGGTILDDNETIFSIFIEHGQAAQLTILDKVLKLHEAIKWILEIGTGLSIRAHFHVLVNC